MNRAQIAATLVPLALLQSCDRGSVTLSIEGIPGEYKNHDGIDYKGYVDDIVAPSEECEELMEPWWYELTGQKEMDLFFVYKDDPDTIIYETTVECSDDKAPPPTMNAMTDDIYQGFDETFM